MPAIVLGDIDSGLTPRTLSSGSLRLEDECGLAAAQRLAGRELIGPPIILALLGRDDEREVLLIRARSSLRRRRAGAELWPRPRISRRLVPLAFWSPPTAPRPIGAPAGQVFVAAAPAQAAARPRFIASIESVLPRGYELMSTIRRIAEVRGALCSGEAPDVEVGRRRRRRLTRLLPA